MKILFLVLINENNPEKRENPKGNQLHFFSFLTCQKGPLAVRYLRPPPTMDAEIRNAPVFPGLLLRQEHSTGHGGDVSGG